MLPISSAYSFVNKNSSTRPDIVTAPGFEPFQAQVEKKNVRSIIRNFQYQDLPLYGGCIETVYHIDFLSYHREKEGSIIN